MEPGALEVPASLGPVSANPRAKAKLSYVVCYVPSFERVRKRHVYDGGAHHDKPSLSLGLALYSPAFWRNRACVRVLALLRLGPHSPKVSLLSVMH